MCSPRGPHLPRLSAATSTASGHDHGNLEDAVAALGESGVLRYARQTRHVRAGTPAVFGAEVLQPYVGHAPNLHIEAHTDIVQKKRLQEVFRFLQESDRIREQTFFSKPYLLGY